MNSKNRIRTLHRTEAATASRIMEHYPPQWDMDKLFQKTYSRYLAQKKEEELCSVEYEVTAAVSKKEERRQGVWRAGGYALFAAASIGMFLFIFRMEEPSPSINNIPDDVQETESAFHEVDSTENTTSGIATEHMMTVTHPTDPPETTSEAETETDSDISESMPQTTADIGILTEPPDTETVISTEIQRADPMEDMTAAPPEQTEATSPMEITDTLPETTAAETTTTTEPPVISLGHFEVGAPSGSFSQITYVREDTSAVEEHEHSFAAEGFTLTNTSVQNPDYPFRSAIFNLEDTAGQSYMVQQHRYEYFAYAYNTSIAWQTRSYTIGGRTVFLVYQDDPESVCNLMWDDGCHVCVMTSQYKDLANMELLVLSQITN